MGHGTAWGVSPVSRSVPRCLTSAETGSVNGFVIEKPPTRAGVGARLLFGTARVVGLVAVDGSGRVRCPDSQRRHAGDLGVIAAVVVECGQQPVGCLAVWDAVPGVALVAIGGIAVTVVHP